MLQEQSKLEEREWLSVVQAYTDVCAAIKDFESQSASWWAEHADQAAEAYEILDAERAAMLKEHDWLVHVFPEPRRKQ